MCLVFTTSLPHSIFPPISSLSDLFLYSSIPALLFPSASLHFQKNYLRSLLLNTLLVDSFAIPPSLHKVSVCGRSGEVEKWRSGEVEKWRSGEVEEEKNAVVDKSKNELKDHYLA
jgi:hypothetical protein